MHCLEIRIQRRLLDKIKLRSIEDFRFFFFLLFSFRTIVRQALVSVFVSARDQIHMELKFLVLVS